MSEIACPKCKSANILENRKCENCGDNFDKYKIVGTSNSISFKPETRKKTAKISFKRIGDQKTSLIILLGIDIVIIIFIILSGQQIICYSLVCLIFLVPLFILLVFFGLVTIMVFYRSIRV